MFASLLNVQRNNVEYSNEALKKILKLHKSLSNLSFHFQNNGSPTHRHQVKKHASNGSLFGKNKHKINYKNLALDWHNFLNVAFI